MCCRFFLQPVIFATCQSNFFLPPPPSSSLAEFCSKGICTYISLGLTKGGRGLRWGRGVKMQRLLIFQEWVTWLFILCVYEDQDVQGVQEKLCFFTIHCNPSLAYIAVRDRQSSQRNASVQSLLLAGNFCTTNSSRVLASERWQSFKNSWKRHNI